MNQDDFPVDAVPAADDRAAWLEYERRKRLFATTHPGATPAEYEAFIQRLTAELGL